jgi:hypothetical protein
MIKRHSHQSISHARRNVHLADIAPFRHKVLGVHHSEGEGEHPGDRAI